MPDWNADANPRWNGGRSYSRGYASVKSPDHPNANKRGYVSEHVLVMSESIGRALSKNEVVHHRNGVRDDNRLENLEIQTRAAHTSHHHKGVRKPSSKGHTQAFTTEQRKLWWATIWAERRSKPKICLHCKEEFFSKKLRRIYCSRQCYGASRRLTGH